MWTSQDSYTSTQSKGLFSGRCYVSVEIPEGNLGGGNSNIFYFHPYLGKIPILTNIFQMVRWLDG